MTFPSPAKIILKLAATVAFLGIACVWAEDGKKDDPASSFKAHPLVFSMIQGWLSDSAFPVATEINLDAVGKNRNQFPNDGIKQEDGWTVFRESGAKGFKRYRLIETTSNHYKVEYQENGGGTLTTSTIIGFSVVKREITANGKPAVIRVIQVDACSTKHDP